MPRVRTQVRLFLLLSFFGCTTDEIVRVDPGDIQVPSRLEFGEVSRAQSRSLDLTIKNAGDRSLIIKGFRLTGADAASFSWTGPETPFSISSDGSKDVRVTFTPDRIGEFEASIVVESDDSGDDAARSVLLTGVGRAVEATTIDGGLVVTDGGVEFVDGGVVYVDGGSLPWDAGPFYVDGGEQVIDGGVVYVDGGVVYIDGGSLPWDAGPFYVDGGERVIDGGVQFIDGGVVFLDGGVGEPSDGGVMYVDGGVVYIDGGVIFRDGGTIVNDGGTVVNDGGTVVNDGGIAVRDGGTVVQFVDAGAGPIRSASCPVSPNVIWEEDFESCNAISARGVWSTTNGVWEFGVSTDCAQGLCCVGSPLVGLYTDGTDSMLLSPPILLPTIGAGESLWISFSHSHNFGGGDQGRVEILSRSGADAGSQFVSVQQEAWRFGTGNLSSSAVEVSAWAGGNIRVGWFQDTADTCSIYDCTNPGGGWEVDCVQLLKF